MTPTPRQWDVLRCLAEDKRDKEIAYELGITQGTLASHLTNLYMRIGVHSRTGAAVWYLKNGENHEKQFTTRSNTGNGSHRRH